MGRGPDLIGIEPAAQKGQCEQRRAGDRRHQMQRRDGPRIVRQRRAGRGDRTLRLLHMDDALGQHEVRAKILGGPEQHRIPRLRLARHQFLRMAGAVEQQIGAEVFGDVVTHRGDVVADRVDDAVGEPRQWHRRRIDGVLLRFPFRNDRFCDAALGRGQRLARRRAHSLVVERNGKAVRCLAETGARVEALALRPARRLAHRLFRIQPALPVDFVKQFTHRVLWSC